VSNDSVQETANLSISNFAALHPKIKMTLWVSKNDIVGVISGVIDLNFLLIFFDPPSDASRIDRTRRTIFSDAPTTTDLALKRRKHLENRGRPNDDCCRSGA
jgi:hypothetical protein